MTKTERLSIVDAVRMAAATAKKEGFDGTPGVLSRIAHIEDNQGRIDMNTVRILLDLPYDRLYLDAMVGAIERRVSSHPIWGLLDVYTRLHQSESAIRRHQNQIVALEAVMRAIIVASEEIFEIQERKPQQIGELTEARKISDKLRRLVKALVRYSRGREEELLESLFEDCPRARMNVQIEEDSNILFASAKKTDDVLPS